MDFAALTDDELDALIRAAAIEKRRRVGRRGGRPPRLVTAFGETKTLAGWAADPRCGVAVTGLRRRLDVLGWEPERAIATPHRLDVPKPAPPPGTSAPSSRPRRGPHRLDVPKPAPPRHWPLHAAFGESRTLADWARDPRCRVGRRVLQLRVVRLGWDVERAITTPPRPKVPGGAGPRP
jgi:hypothetical protein